MAAGLRADHRTAVRAAVVQHVNRAVGMAHHQYRPGGQACGEVVAGLGHLARMAHIQPRTRPQALHFQREDRGVHVDVAVDLIGLDEG